MPRAADDRDPVMTLSLRFPDGATHPRLPLCLPALRLRGLRTEFRHRFQNRIEQTHRVAPLLDLVLPPQLAVRVACRKRKLPDWILLDRRFCVGGLLLPCGVCTGRYIRRSLWFFVASLSELVRLRQVDEPGGNPAGECVG